MTGSSSLIGPLLYERGTDGTRGRTAASVLLGVAEGAAPPAVAVRGRAIVGRVVDTLCGVAFHRFDIAVSPGLGCYEVGAERFEVHSATAEQDLRVAFASCNGQESGDFDRSPEAREALWARLLDAHRDAPFSLLLLGGDQIYADAVIETHPDLARWAELSADRAGDVPATAEAEAAATAFFFDRWQRSLAGPLGVLMARIPTAAMWDDHDIFDGYGSHPSAVQESPVVRMLFRVAARIFRLFHTGGGAPAEARTYSWALDQAGFTVIAPDLRSERRPTRVMGPAGWALFERDLARADAGKPVFILSTVPALGPRLSLLEGLHRLVPRAQRYEDDLRDQWQSRAHRAEWRRFLEMAARRADTAGPVTFLSGEIHLAARGEMATPNGAVLHQLISSGVAHAPPPKAFARGLALLGRLGEAPLKSHPITFPPLPGRAQRFVAERNVLILERRSGRWRAAWDLEDTGMTEWLSLPDAPAARGAATGASSTAGPAYAAGSVEADGRRD